MKSLKKADKLVVIEILGQSGSELSSCFITDGVGAELVRVAAEAAGRGHEMGNVLSPATYEQVAGTHLQDVIFCSYDVLCRAFGKPHHNRPSDEERRAEWCFTYADIEPFTIYDWDQPDVPVKKVLKWNVGGKSPEIVSVVRSFINDVL